MSRFAKLLFPMLLLCIVSLAILASFKVVNGMFLPDPHENYYSLMDAKELEAQKKFTAHGADRNAMKDYALLLWQNTKIETALPYFDRMWSEHHGKDKTTYDSVFVEDGLNLAGLYLDRGSNVLASQIYDRLIEYESAHLKPNDVRLGREYNNLGLCYYRTGEAEPLAKDRKEWFEKAMVQYKKAEQIFRLSKQTNPQLICSLQNQVFAYSELGDDDRALRLSRIVNKQLDAWGQHKDAAPPEMLN